MSQLDLNAAVMPPPPGETQNLDNPPNGNGIIIGVYTTCIVIATTSAVLRTYSKFFLLKLARIEDYLLIPTLGIFIAHCVFWMMMNGTTGSLVHMWDFRIGGLAPFYRNGFYGTLLYETVMMAIKPMILFEWMHIFASAGPRNLFNWTCYILSAINVLTYFISIMIDATSCTPREYWWDQTIEGHCVDTKSLPIATAIINVIVDVFILLLPQGIIWRLNMSRAKRAGVSCVFFIGLISVTAATARLALSVAYSTSVDVTYQFSQAGILIVLEMTFAILVFTSPHMPKPVSLLAQATGASLTRLVRTGSRSGSGHHSTVSGQRNYRDINENGDFVPLHVLRSSKSSRSLPRRMGKNSVDSEVQFAKPDMPGLP
ncbi:hypothetical protein GGS26DRAFT_304384 [Hypomontagnella submonticulosa]|nr:hypothetical protein GGS26DRAFT_304384 [Hypomontagnella submonticulosa]